MKTYYSIVSISTKPSLDEKFNIGLLCVTPENTFFHFSETKFKIVSKLLSENGSKLALSALKGIKNQINAFIKKDGLFEYHQTEVSKSYLSYLHRYNNNLLQFSLATEIDLNIDFSKFQVLFKKYIFSEEVFDLVIKPEKPRFERIRTEFKKSASTYANTDFKVNQSIISGLVAPTLVDVFGKNGSFVASQTIDFSKSTHFLQKEVNNFMFLAINTQQVDREAKNFILGDAPSKSDKENHAIWKNLSQSTLVETIALDESEKIIEYMQEKGVLPIVNS